MMYRIIEEASEAIICYSDDLYEAISEAKSYFGKYLVLDNDDNIVFDSEPGVSYKI